MVTSRAAAAAGLDAADLRRLVRGGELVPIRRGVYADARRWEQLEPYREQPLLRIRAAQLVLRCQHVLSHDSAALVLGLGCPDPVHALVHVTRPKVHGDAVRAGVKHHLAPYSPTRWSRSVTSTCSTRRAQHWTWRASTVWSRAWHAATRRSVPACRAPPSTTPARGCSVGRTAA
ncbi:MAG: type IV toxin-antitoxin system AbiEi family antitoxin domain-containing protein [Nocardioides sp.]|nr:type IV toxin-antitoxin system AbiEi family antitoxin domain-containing protein [Nocardioides sp.]